MKLLSANKVEPNNVVEVPLVLKKHMKRSRNYPNVPTTRRSRIISVSATGDAYLWEVETLIDLNNDGGVLRLNVLPPLVSIDGMVAAVSGKGMPVKYPPALSFPSIATLSASSSRLLG